MRLLHCNDDGTFELTQHTEEDEVPKYAILSHTWLADEEEVSFEEMVNGAAKRKTAGYRKIQFCGQQAMMDGLKFFWLDTCCIKKESSSELQEAITTMFSWYSKAARCYVYLADVSVSKTRNDGHHIDQNPSHSWEAEFRRSRWFTRGWTLQELLAPASVEFFSSEGTRLGDKASLEQWIVDITGIPSQALRGETLSNFSVAERFSWTANRQTKRKEDKAYCLLGIFGVFMPLMYGEGDHAFARLQQEAKIRRDEFSKLDLSLLPVASEPALSSFDDQINRPTCLGGTCVELLHEIADWIYASDDRCIFWLKGMAGTGKSTIARTIAKIYHNKGNLGATFFFSRGAGDLSNAKRLITTLASQLATRVPLSRRFIYEAIKAQKDIAEQPIDCQWDKLIHRPLSFLNGNSSPSPILFVIDALDECGSERDVLALPSILANASQLKHVRLRILITSRVKLLVSQGFENLSGTAYRETDHGDIPPMIINRDLNLFFMSQLSAIATEYKFEDGWPGPPFIERLVDMSCGLFIWASSACRIIGESRELAMRRITELTSGHHVSTGPEKQLDQIYIRLLQESQDYGHHTEKERRNGIQGKILGSVVNLLLPLSMESLAKLLDVSLDDIKETLVGLNTIFRMPHQSSNPIYLRHRTFRDFLLDNNRCAGLGFQVKEKQAHEALADRCIAIMSRMLKRDICGVEKPDTLARAIEKNLIDRFIPSELQYACLYWVQHYQHGEVRLVDGDSVHLFVQEHFLHWLEVMYILGKSSDVPAIVRLYHSLLVADRNMNQLQFIKDARRFVSAFQSIMKKAPLQAYCAALIFIPSTNQLSHHFRNQRHPWIKSFQVSEAIDYKLKDEFNYVNDLAFTPDGRQIASGSNTEVARLWDVGTKAALHRFEGPTSKVSTVSISPDGALIAAGSDDSTISVWDLKTKALRFHLKGHSNWVNAVVFSPDGKLLASGAADKTVVVWEAKTGKFVQRLQNQSSVNSISFSPRSSYIAAGSVDGKIRLWDISQQTPKLYVMYLRHKGSVSSVGFSPNEKHLVSGSDDETIKVWDISNMKDIMTLRGHTKRVTSVTFSPNARLIVSGSEDRSIRVWDAITGRFLCAIRKHTSGVNAVLFSADGRLLASGSFDDEVRIWDTRCWEQRSVLDDFEENQGPLPLSAPNIRSQIIRPNDFQGHPSRVTAMVFSPDGQMIGSGSQDGMIKIWLINGLEYWKLEGHCGSINHLAFSSNSHLVASASADQTVRLWNILTGIQQYTLAGHYGSIRQVTFSPNNQMIASTSADMTVILWDVTTGSKLFTLKFQSAMVNDIIFSPDNGMLATCSTNGTVVLLDTMIAKVITLEGHSSSVNAIAFSPDGDLLVSGSDDRTLRLWGRDGRRYDMMRSHNLPIKSVSFSPTENLVVYCSADGAVRLWDLPNLAQANIESSVQVRRVCFSSDGKFIETNRGALSVTLSSNLDSSHLSNTSMALFAGQDWVKRGVDNIVWIPEEFEVSAVVTRDDVIVLGHSSGRISFLVL